MSIFCCAILRWNSEVMQNNSLFSHTMQFHGVQHTRHKELVKSSQHGRTLVKNGSSIGGSSVTHSLETRTRISLGSMRDRAKFISIIACLPLNAALQQTHERSAPLCRLRRSPVLGGLFLVYMGWRVLSGFARGYECSCVSEIYIIIIVRVVSHLRILCRFIAPVT